MSDLDLNEDAHTHRPFTARTSDALKRALDCLFEMYYLFYAESTAADRGGDLLVAHCAVMLVHGLQMLSLVFPCDLTSWDSFEWFSHAVMLVRMDYLAVSFGLGAVYFYFTVAFEGVAFAALGLMFYKLFRGSVVNPANYKFILSWPLQVLVHVLYLPSISIMVAVGKYS